MYKLTKELCFNALVIVTIIMAASSCSTTRQLAVSRPFLSRADTLALNQVIGQLDSVKSRTVNSMPRVNSLTIGGDSSVRDSTIVERIITERDTSTSIVLFDAVAKLFDPEEQPCDLPDKVLQKLKSMKNNKTPWIPRYIKDHLASLPKLAYTINTKSLTAVLHSIELRRPDGTIYNWELQQSPTYKNLSVNDFINTSGYNSFAYTLDCSGYMNAAIEVAGVTPGSDIKAKAGTALLEQKSMFVGGGIVISPIVGAIYSNELGLNMEKELRVAILQAIVDIPLANDTDVITNPASYEVVWASKEGKNSFNGEVGFAAKGGVGIGIAQISGSGTTGGSISRTGTFSSFQTYVTATKRHPIAPVSILMVRQLLTSLNSSK